MEEIIKSLKDEYPKELLKLCDGLELTNDALGKVIYAMGEDMKGLIEQKEFTKVSEMSHSSEELLKTQAMLEKMIDLTKAETNEKISERTPLPDYESYTVDASIPYSLNESFTHKKVCAFSIRDAKYDVTDWQDLLVTTCNLLGTKNLELLKSLLDDPDMRGRKVNYFTTYHLERKTAKLEHENLYVWINQSANSIVRMVKKLLKKFDIPENAYKVYLRADYNDLHK